MERYKHLNNYYKERFGERTLKICIDGNFTCPNRDGTCGNGGCIFCSEQGSGELIKNNNHAISSQVKAFLESYKAERANKYIVYFQNFSNTYDSIDNLKAKYDSSLIDNRIIGISIATRPDCIDESIAKLLSTYTEKYYVCVELGLQTSDDEIGEIINRGYKTEKYIEAVKILKKYDIDIITHIMCGLPGEKRDDYFNEKKKTNQIEILKSKLYKNMKLGEYVPKSIVNTVELINSLNINGIKIHSTYVVKNTVLEKLFFNKEYIPLEFEEYMFYLTYIITHLNPEIVVHRICADAPKDILIAPEWNAHKKWVMNGLDRILKEENLQQGCFGQGGHFKKKL